MARCAASTSSAVSGCLEKCTAVSSRLYVMRFGTSTKQRRNKAQLVSTYHCPGAFSGCWLSLSAILQLTQDHVEESQDVPSKATVTGERSRKFTRREAVSFNLMRATQGRAGNIQ